MRAFTLGVGRTVVLRMLGIGGERQEWEVGTGWGGDGRDRRAYPLHASWCKQAGQYFQTNNAFLELVPLSIQAEEFVRFRHKARA